MLRMKAALRYELKYMITHEQAGALQSALAAYLERDPHQVRPEGYTVSSIYFDTTDHKAYWDKLEGHKVRRKVRVRAYGDEPLSPDSEVFLEVKQRVDRKMAKRRVRLPYAQAIDLDALATLRDAGGAIDGADERVISEVHYLHQTLRLTPACLVRYTRLALEGNEAHPDLRVTFDTNLRGRLHMPSLLSMDQSRDDRFLAPNRTILEVKVNQSVPGWLSALLRQHRCRLQRVSKYCETLEAAIAIRGRSRFVEA